MISFIDSLKAFGRCSVTTAQLEKIQERIFEGFQEEIDMCILEAIAVELGYQIERSEKEITRPFIV